MSSNAFGDAITGLSATAATRLTDLKAGGGALGVVAGDTLRISGRTGNGSTVTTSVAITADTTVGDVLGAINHATTGFGAGTRPAIAALTGGRISLTDGTAGESQLSLTVSVDTAAGSATSLGTFTTGNGGQAGVSRVLVAGADADVTIDGQRVTSASNTISNAVAGVSLNLLQASAGESIDVSVTTDTSAITGLIKEFVSSYNALRSFVKSSTAAGGALHNNATVRSIASGLTSRMTGALPGLTGTYTTASLVGLQHDANGVLSLNESVLTTALAADFDGARAVFSVLGTPSSADVTFVSSTTATKASDTPYALAITQAATQATATGASWSTYATTGTPDTMTVLDGSTGVSTNVTLTDGDTIANVASRLNAAFALSRMHLTAAVDASRLVLTSTEYGSTGGFSVAYTPGTGNGTAALGIAAQAYAGLDVAGTLNGVAGTGRGQLLTGASKDDTEGLAVRYTGTAIGAMGTVRLSLGVGGLIQQVAEAATATGIGSVDQQLSALTAQSERLNARAARVEQMLADRRAALTKQFVAMEAAMAKAQSLGVALNSQMNAMKD
jgi:flagellar hook-associated protein 2